MERLKHWSGEIPMEIMCFEIKRVGIRHKPGQSFRDCFSFPGADPRIDGNSFCSFHEPLLSLGCSIGLKGFRPAPIMTAMSNSVRFYYRCLTASEKEPFANLSDGLKLNRVIPFEKFHFLGAHKNLIALFKLKRVILPDRVFCAPQGIEIFRRGLHDL